MQRWKPARLSRKEVELYAPLPPAAPETPIMVRAAGSAGRPKILGLLEPDSQAARALGAWRSDLKKPTDLLAKALESPDKLTYALVYAASAALLLFVLGLFGPSAHERSRPSDHLIFVKDDPGPAARDSAPADPQDTRSGLDMEPALPLPASRPAPPPEPAPAAEPPQDSTPPPSSPDDDRPDWAAPVELAKQSETAPAGAAPAHPALAPIDLPHDAASKATSAAMLTLGRVEQPPSVAAPAPAPVRPARMPYHREFRDLVGRVYGR